LLGLKEQLGTSQLFAIRLTGSPNIDRQGAAACAKSPYFSGGELAGVARYVQSISVNHALVICFAGTLHLGALRGGERHNL
jgi:hypothetical protein